MGFVPQVQTVRLTFEPGHDYHGLEVVTRRPDIGRVASLMDLAEYIGADPEAITPESVKRLVGILDQAVEIFAEHLLSWNVEREVPDSDETVPVPASREGMRTQSDEFMLNLVAYWMRESVGVTADLGKDSTSGLPSPEVSVPMELLSANRAS